MPGPCQRGFLSVFACRAVGSAALLVWTALLATEKEATPPPQASAEVLPLDQAKRQFDEAQRLKKEFQEPKSSLPNIEGPSWQPTVNPAQQASQSKALDEEQKLMKAKERQKNWLVNGVHEEALRAERKAGASENLRKKTNEVNRSPRSDEGDGSSKDSQFVESEDPGGDAKERVSQKSLDQEKPAANPLQDYLANWMSPKDYQLLIQGPSAGGSAGVAQGGSNASVFGQQPANAANWGDKKGLNAARTQNEQNPFLQGLLGQEAGAVQSQRSAPEHPVAPEKRSMQPSVLTPIAPEQKNPRGDLEEKLKMKDDKKYFPQMKRF